MKEFDYSDIEVATGGFALENLIGKGSHGCVYRGVLGGGKRVAVKAPSQGLRLLGDGEKLENEIDVLASVRGRYLVNLLGISRSPAHGGQRLLVIEHMPNGSLHDLLHGASPAAAAPPAWPWRAVVALQVARAVRTLHEAAPPVIHRDIKSANIMFDERWNARLADFSLAVRETHEGAHSPPAGTIGYLDPGYTAPGKLSPKNDVFSFGVVLLELVSCRMAMDAACITTSIVAWALPLIRDGRVLEVSDQRVALTCSMERALGRVLDVAARCVSSDEKGRPSMGEVVAELQAVVEQMRSRRRRLLKALFWAGGSMLRPCTGTPRTKRRIVCRDHLVHDENDKCGHRSG
ncbi:hypothetical protein Taro_032309 [Colocasia esculenta]|uniref:Protein kinase domain-containing protein n=1 Tax=Colocasia esculenta TaxID=4460 RepID=A0A843VR21_COLES|nr:hypothetical protein [Colocasia esculenta]